MVGTVNLWVLLTALCVLSVGELAALECATQSSIIESISRIGGVSAEYFRLSVCLIMYQTQATQRK